MPEPPVLGGGCAQLVCLNFTGGKVFIATSGDSGYHVLLKREMYSHHTWYIAFSTPFPSHHRQIQLPLPSPPSAHAYLFFSIWHKNPFLFVHCTSTHVYRRKIILNVHFMFMDSQRLLNAVIIKLFMSARWDIKVDASFTFCWKCPTRITLELPIYKSFSKVHP